MTQAERRKMPKGIPGGWMNKVRKGWKGGKGSGVGEVPKVKGGTGKAGTGWLRWVTCMPGQWGWNLDFRTRDSGATFLGFKSWLYHSLAV